MRRRGHHEPPLLVNRPSCGTSVPRPVSCAIFSSRLPAMFFVPDVPNHGNQDGDDRQKQVHVDRSAKPVTSSPGRRLITAAIARQSSQAEEILLPEDLSHQAKAARHGSHSRVCAAFGHNQTLCLRVASFNSETRGLAEGGTFISPDRAMSLAGILRP